MRCIDSSKNMFCTNGGGSVFSFSRNTQRAPLNPGEHRSSSPARTFTSTPPPSPLPDQVEIYVNVVEVPVVGTSASTRTPISATATTDASSVMNTLVRQALYVLAKILTPDGFFAMEYILTIVNLMFRFSYIIQETT